MSYQYSPVSGVDGSYPMQEMGGNNGGDFFTRIADLQDSIRAYNDKVTQIGQLHTRLLSSMNANDTARIDQEISVLTEQVRSSASQIKKELQIMKSTGVRSSAERNQIQRLSENFKSSVEKYQNVEMQYRRGVQDRMKRQFKIVQPDATPEQINEVVNNPGNQQIFSQALLNSSRYGEARTAYREVQDRHQELQKIEQTMAELAQLFNDLSIIVEQQQETIEHIQTNAYNVEQDTEKANGQLMSAVKSAAGARKKRKICFIISIVLILVIAAVAAGAICGNGLCHGSGSSTNKS
ncbi:syntaxin [Flagelloscypha sp. PMI_526]|nr:syntaxin [Flagelloscypha sp. PMI_526]